MSQFWNNRTQALKPYIPGEQPQDKQYIKLNTNENPHPPSDKVLEAIHLAIDSGLNLYPDPECRVLKEAISQYYDLPVNCVFVGT